MTTGKVGATVPQTTGARQAQQQTERDVRGELLPQGLAPLLPFILFGEAGSWVNLGSSCSIFSPLPLQTKGSMLANGVGMVARGSGSTRAAEIGLYRSTEIIKGRFRASLMAKVSTTFETGGNRRLLEFDTPQRIDPRSWLYFWGASFDGDADVAGSTPSIGMTWKDASISSLPGDWGVDDGSSRPTIISSFESYQFLLLTRTGNRMIS